MKQELTDTMVQLARYWFGHQYHGLDCDKCSYPEFKKWYEESHETECTPALYAVATFIWTTCTRR